MPSYTHTLTGSLLVLKTAGLELALALPVSASDLGCDRMNITLAASPAEANPSVVCPGLATGRTPSDPAHPGVLMDTWTDIVLGPPGNLNGSVDTTDCYCGGLCCYGVLQSRMQKGLLSREGFSVVDDSGTALWDDADPPGPGSDSWRWRKPRPKAPAGAKDLYVRSFAFPRLNRLAAQPLLATRRGVRTLRCCHRELTL